MTDFLYPQGTPVTATQIEMQGNAASYRSPLSGATRTSERLGDLWSAKLSLRNLNGQNRARVQSFLSGLRGRSNRFYLQDHSYRQRGSFVASELFSNNGFTNGTTGWNPDQGILTVADRVARLKVQNQNNYTELFQSVTLAAYTPYALRSVILDGAQSAGFAIGPAMGTTEAQYSDYSASRGLRVVSGVSHASTAVSQFPTVFSSVIGLLAGAYVDVPWCSIARCALVDNGPNLLTYSDDGTQSAWTVAGLNAPTFGATSPDGNATATRLFENGANSSHLINHSNVNVIAGAQDLAFSVVFKAGTRSWCYLTLTETTGPSGVTCFFNISTGATGTSSVGANWNNFRSFVTNLGGGFYMVTIVARKTNAATLIAPTIGVATADNSSVYTGSSGSNAMNFWRATLASSGVPTRLVQTGSAVTNGANQTGVGLRVKGLPASSSGLLLPGDQVQIGDQLDIVTASLDSDAAGLGYLQLTRPQRSAPADGAPVIINTPMAKFMLATPGAGWSNAPGLFSDADVEAVEAV